MRPVAVTGLGLICAFGEGLEPLLGGLFDGRTALQPREGFPGGVSAAVPSGPFMAPGAAVRLATGAARAALAEAALPRLAQSRAGLALGTIVGEAGGGLCSQRTGLSVWRREALEGAWEWGTLAERVARRLGLGGVVTPVSTACASGTDALGLAAWEVGTGRTDAMVAGGVECLTPFQWEGFRRLGALDPRAVRPFDRDRGGTGLGEGACFWVLEAERSAHRRGARVLGRLCGWSTAGDANNLVAPHPAGRGLRAAAGRALDAAGIGPDEVAFAVAHATGTPANDAAEARALRDLFGERAADRLPITGLKGALGHCLGAAGAVEAAAALGFLNRGQVPPVVGLQSPDPALGIHPVRGEPRTVAGRFALTLSAGFGGQNAALVLERGAW